jgi:hypothetical protein
MMQWRSGVFIEGDKSFSLVGDAEA